jgi:L-iditol 2-dehydrogenase
MKALVLEEYNRLDYKDVPDPDVGPEDVLVRVKACGICGSDVHGLDGSTGRRMPPLIMGHEASGVIAGVGKNVTGWQEGDRVTFDSTIYCGKCHFCRRGEINLCDNRRVLGVSPGEYRQHGAFAEYVAVPQHILYRLPEGVSFEQAAMVEALSVAFHAVGRTPISLNDSAAVVGTGMIGLSVIQSLRVAGCGTIIAVDLDQGRLELARQLGADVTLNPEQEDVVVQVLRLTENRGADVAFEAVGISPTLELAIKCARKGGAVTLVGNWAPTTEFPMQAVVTRELTLYGSCASRGEYPACLDMISRGAVDVDVMVSAVAPLAEGASWFQRLHHGESGLMKVILTP